VSVRASCISPPPDCLCAGKVRWRACGRLLHPTVSVGRGGERAGQLHLPPTRLSLRGEGKVACVRPVASPDCLYMGSGTYRECSARDEREEKSKAVYSLAELYRRVNELLRAAFLPRGLSVREQSRGSGVCL